MMMTIADQLRHIRNERGWNQRDLADHMRVTQSTVSRWEKGVMPTGEVLSEIAKLAGKTVDALLSGAGQTAATTPATMAGMNIEILGSVQTGAVRPAFEQPEARRTVTIPRLRNPVAGLYGMTMLDLGMLLAYRRGTMLVCAPVAEARPDGLKQDDHVIAIRQTDAGVEVICRSLTWWHGWHLLPLTSAADVGPAILGTPDENPPADVKGIAVARIVGVVVGHFTDLT